jgi:hypothetical protein
VSQAAATAASVAASHRARISWLTGSPLALRQAQHMRRNLVYQKSTLAKLLTADAWHEVFIA